MANKGGLIVSIKINSYKVGVLNLHLPSGIKEAKFKRAENLKILTRKFEKFSHCDLRVIFGDFNFRNSCSVGQTLLLQS